MAEEVIKLKTLSEIKHDAIQKRWILKDKADYPKICDYLQKINYSINDLNDEIPCLTKTERKDIVYVISLIDWIIEAFVACKNAIREVVIENFSFSKQGELNKAYKYFKALRSFVVAHPLSTNKHKNYGFDGDFICIDIAGWNSVIDTFYPEIYYYHLDYDGIHDGVKEAEDDIILRSYSGKKDNWRFSRSVTCKMKDIYHVAELYIDRIYELNKYLSKQKKAMYEGK